MLPESKRPTFEEPEIKIPVAPDTVPVLVMAPANVETLSTTMPVRVALIIPLLTMSPVKLVMPHEHPTTIPVPAVIIPPLLRLPMKVRKSDTEMPAPLAEIVPPTVLMMLPVKVPISATAMPETPPTILPLLMMSPLKVRTPVRARYRR